MDPHADGVKTEASAQRGWLRSAAGYAVGAVCLAWVLHDVHFGRMLGDFGAVNWWWVGPAVLADVASYVCQGIRWELLLRSVGNLSPVYATEAIYAGLFTSEVLPMRPGELVRAYLVSRRLAVDFLRVIPSIAVERLFDGVWLALAFGLTAIFVPLPKDLVEAGDVLGGVVLVGTALFVYAVLRRRKSATPGEAPRTRSGPMRLVASFFSHLVSELQAIGFSHNLHVSFLWSFLVLFFQALAFWLVMLAYGIRESFWVGAAVLLIVHLGTAIPNAPANVGTFQFFCVVALRIFGVEKTLASGFSVVVFVILTAPLWAIGLWAIGRSGTTLAAIRGEIRRLLARAQAPPLA